MGNLFNNPKAFAAAAEELYARVFKSQYEPTHNGQFIAIDPESGKAFVAKCDVDALKQAEEALPDSHFHLMRIGFRAAYSLI